MKKNKMTLHRYNYLVDDIKKYLYKFDCLGDCDIIWLENKLNMLFSEMVESYPFEELL